MKTVKKPLAAALTLALVLGVFIIAPPQTAKAAAGTLRIGNDMEASTSDATTTVIDLGSSGSGDGWEWNPTTETLTLNPDFSRPAVPYALIQRIILPSKLTVMSPSMPLVCI